MLGRSSEKLMDSIGLAVSGSTAIVTLNRPAARNALTLLMWQRIPQIFRELDEQAEVKAIVLTGEGGNFSVGADISEFSEVRQDSQASVAYEVAVDAASEAIASSRKPVIAVLQGYCLGGGCHLALACDFRFADTAVSIGIPAARLSIVYGIRSTQRLLSLVGLTNAKRILFGAERFGAQEAIGMGIVDRVSEDPMREAKAFAASMAMLAPLSIAGAKQILNGLARADGKFDERGAQELIDVASNSEDYEEGRSAFMEKRPPRFKGA